MHRPAALNLGGGVWGEGGDVHRPVYIESRVCVVKEAVMCSFEY